MRMPLRLMMDLGRYMRRKRRSGEKYFPLVLMLEPLHACNLACIGCGRIVEYKYTIRDMMPLDEALQSAEEANAPIVSICGGEPLMYKHIAPLTKGLIEQQKRHVMICTNAILLERFVKQVEPSPYLSFNIHLDEMIKFLTTLGIDGMLLSPGYHYQVLGNDEVYLKKEEMPYKFMKVRDMANDYKIVNTPIYLDYLVGKRDLTCSPWTTVTRNPQGWKGPCYLITNGHYQTFEEMHAATDWEYYRTKQDIRCRDCKLHSGFEGTVALDFGKNLKDSWRMVRHYVA